MVAETKQIFKFMLRPWYRYLYESNLEFVVFISFFFCYSDILNVSFSFPTW